MPLIRAIFCAALAAVSRPLAAAQGLAIEVMGGAKGANMAKVKTTTRLLDRLFVGGCTAAYVVLIASVAAALRFYAS
jgi:hypothetical protein